MGTEITAVVAKSTGGEGASRVVWDELQSRVRGQMQIFVQGGALLAHARRARTW